MRAFVVDAFGEPGSVREVPDPAPQPGQVLVRVRAAGVNPADWAVVMGMLAQYGIEHRFPLIPGIDLSGEVVEAPGDEALVPGDEVYGGQGAPYYGEGSWAELVAIGSGDVSVKPVALEHTGAAGVATAGLTALEAVDAAGVGEGGVLLVVGATGGVGSYAVQLAALRGNRVVAVSSGEKAEYATELGAAETIDYTQGDVVDLVRAAHPDGVDALIDLASDVESVTSLSKVVREGGAVISAKGGVDIEAMEAAGKRGVNANRAALSRLPEMSALFDDGKLWAPHTTPYALERAQDAVDEVATGHVRGKLALTI